MTGSNVVLGPSMMIELVLLTSYYFDPVAPVHNYLNLYSSESSGSTELKSFSGTQCSCMCRPFSWWCVIFVVKSQDIDLTFMIGYDIVFIYMSLFGLRTILWLPAFSFICTWTGWPCRHFFRRLFLFCTLCFTEKTGKIFLAHVLSNSMV